MLFQTWTFLLFFAAVYLLFRCIKSGTGRSYLLLAASFIFYGWWNPLFLLLLWWIIIADYLVIMFIERTGRRKLFLVLSITNSIALLGSFKYAGFIILNINALIVSTGASYRLPAPGFILPVGISFFVFISMGYVIDFYYGRVEREKSLARHALFVSFFPQLSAGPIARAGKLIPQFRDWKNGSASDLADGMLLFVSGLFKKAALADYFALYADRIFGSPAQFSSPDLLLGAMAFTWQIYFDFSGYTDMARGIARCFGIELMENFRLPYMAASTGEFWGRWHISLSSWFRDYVYIPLGGNRNGRFNEIRNIIITMLLSGLWHGAAWNFVLWGFIHGTLHASGRLIRKIPGIGHVPLFIRRILIFTLVMFAWIFFRAESAADAYGFIRGIFTGDFTAPVMPYFMMALMAACFICEWFMESGGRVAMLMEKPAVKSTAAILMLAWILLFASTDASDFIYFQF